jgi:hypothetical protein
MDSITLQHKPSFDPVSVHRLNISSIDISAEKQYHISAVCLRHDSPSRTSDRLKTQNPIQSRLDDKP